MSFEKGERRPVCSDSWGGSAHCSRCSRPNRGKCTEERRYSFKVTAFDLQGTLAASRQRATVLSVPLNLNDRRSDAITPRREVNQNCLVRRVLRQCSGEL